MPSLSEQPCYTIIGTPLDSDTPNESQFKLDFEKGDTKTKIASLKKLICLMLNGEKFPGLLMHVIRFVMPVADNKLKKLLLIFWEIVPKHDADGKLLNEMILVCDAYRRDLMHPNEYVRGATLRFLCRLKEPELLEPLMASIRSCLEHRHQYVRRNAVLAIFIIYKNFDYLIADAPELVLRFLESETDVSCKRNAFMMLIRVNQEKALSYLLQCVDQVHSFGDILQLIVVELIHRVCKANPSERVRFIKLVYSLLNANSASVRYEAAGTLVSMSVAPSIIKASAQCYIDLSLKESDNNVKLIVLDQLFRLKELHVSKNALQELAIDILRILNSTDVEVTKRTLDLVIDLTCLRNIKEVIQVLKRELLKTQQINEEVVADERRYLIVRALHQCTMRFPDIAEDVLPMLAEYLPQAKESTALDVLMFIKEILGSQDALRECVLAKILDSFSYLKIPSVVKSAVWIIAEFSTEHHEIIKAVNLILQGFEDASLSEGGKDSVSNIPAKLTAPLVTKDGTYATQSALIEQEKSKESGPTLFKMLTSGEYFVIVGIAAALCKLIIKCRETNISSYSELRWKAVKVMILMLRVGQSSLPSRRIADDEFERILFCMRMIAAEPSINSIFVQTSSDALHTMLQYSMHEDQEKRTDKGLKQPDDAVIFSQLNGGCGRNEDENVFDLTLRQAVASPSNEKDISKLNSIYQLTGLSDPVYAECFLTVSHFDIALDILVVNQTTETLQNLTVELATLGHLKVVEKPSLVTLGPHDFCSLSAHVKVASTENAVLFGNVVYDLTVGGTVVIVLDDLKIDVLDYIYGAKCSESEFRKMWIDFEWENKVSVNAIVQSPQSYLSQLLSATNLCCLTPAEVLNEDCGFLAANLYGRSIFGEDVLANLCIENTAMTVGGKSVVKVLGHIRIRAKSQGMALSMGDKIIAAQKLFKE